MILPLHEQVRARVREVLAQQHGITDPDLVIPIEYPPNRTLGDLGTPVAFDLARRGPVTLRLYDTRGRVVGFGARQMSGDDRGPTTPDQHEEDEKQAGRQFQCGREADPHTRPGPAPSQGDDVGRAWILGCHRDHLRSARTASMLT